MNLTLSAALTAFVVLASAAVAQAGHGCACDQACGCEPACDAACGCDACGGCDCLDCCDWNCGPAWEFRASYLYLERDRLDSVNILNRIDNNSNTIAEVLNGDDFQFDHESGVDLAGIYHYGCGRSIEARYVWIDNWQDTVNRVLPAGFDFALNVVEPFPIGTMAPVDFSSSYESEFRSGEINLRRETCGGNVVVFAGFRYIEFNEFLDACIDGGAAQAAWRTRNDLYGFQVGAHGLLWENCRGWRVQGSMRAGIFNNDGESVFGSSTIFGTSAGAANAEDDEIAFAGEAELLAAYQLNCTWSLHAGYRLLLIDGLAIAANQVPATQGDFDPPISSTLDQDGTLFAHGLVVGVGAAW